MFNISQKYFWKRAFAKNSTWIILFLHLAFVGLLLATIKKDWFFGMQREIVERSDGHSWNIPIMPKISNVNSFFSIVFPNLIFLPILIWTYVFSPLSWLFWGQFDEVGQKTQTDGTDLFFLSTEIPTSRKQIFWRKVSFLVSFFSVLHLLLFALPLSLLLWKVNYFSNFTGLQTFLFLSFSFLIIPLLLFIPLVILLFSLASLNSFWYTLLKWFGRLSVIFIMLLGLLVLQTLRHGGGLGEKILQWSGDFSNWLSQNYLLTTLVIIGTVIFLTLLTLPLAYRDYQKKDLH